MQHKLRSKIMSVAGILAMAVPLGKLAGCNPQGGAPSDIQALSQPYLALIQRHAPEQDAIAAGQRVYIRHTPESFVAVIALVKFSGLKREIIAAKAIVFTTLPEPGTEKTLNVQFPCSYKAGRYYIRIEISGTSHDGTPYKATFYYPYRYGSEGGYAPPLHAAREINCQVTSLAKH